MFNKCFPGIPSRKRSRSDVFSGDRSSVLFSSDRSVMGPTVGKMCASSHTIASGLELDQQKQEEKTKNLIPNKRTRTAIADPRIDARLNTPVRMSGNSDRDKEGPRLPSNSATQVEDQTLPMGIDGWEKSKMKKKRSGIKADAAPSSISLKPIDGYREPKQGLQPKHLPESRPRLNDTYGFRSGAVNGIVGVVKPDGTSQPASLGVRSSVPRSDQDIASAPHERRVATSLDKERVNSGAVNKTNTREEFTSASPTSTVKLNTASRAPRSGSGIVAKVSPVVQRPSATTDWEVSQCTSNNLTATGEANSSKHASSNQSSSAPVAQWACQRPQKISRTARRTNFVPVTSNDETPSLDTISDAAGNENGTLFPSRLSSNSPQRVRIKGDQYPSNALSDSEESGAAEVKSKDKGKNSNEADNKSGKKVQKITTLIVPPKKNKVAIGDGIRRQGRTGRGLNSTRSLVPVTIEKHGNMGSAKQLSSTRFGFEKTESKTGRPPTRKLSDRKGYTRQKHNTVNAAADFLVGSDDGHEELLAAANAVVKTASTFSSSFWRQMEQLFRFISEVDIDYLKQQGNIDISASKSRPVPSDGLLHGGTVLERMRNITEAKYSDLSPEHLSPGPGSSTDIPLCQILLSALISEDGIEEPCCSENEGSEFNTYGSDEFDEDLEPDSFSHQSLHNFELAGRTGLGGYRITANGRSFNELEHNLSDKDSFSMPGMWITSGVHHSPNDLVPDQAAKPVLSCSDVLYNKMSINERALLEIQSIGLFPEPGPDVGQTGDDKISRDISELEDKYHDQVCRKKDLLDKLLKSSMESRELQEKEFERNALEKLVGMAYEKYMSCWGPNAPGGKSASSKMAKQASLAFVKRTLDRCREFEVTGKSCFGEPLFREMFLSRLSDAQRMDVTRDGESGRHYGRSSREGRISGLVGTPQTSSVRNHDVYSPGTFFGNYPSVRNIGEKDTWSNRVKKRELLLDDVVGGVGTSPGVSPGIVTSISSSAKGKRSDRDREGKGNNRDVLSRNGTTKNGRTTSGNMKVEKKSKLKPKQKTTQLSSVNSLIGKMSEQPKNSPSSIPKSGDMTLCGSGREKDNLKLNVVDNCEAIDFSTLHMDGGLDVPDELGDQGQDIGSWLNIDDDGLQDDDIMGLEIPMDDLSELNMMV
ncbi:hypothetical protein AgCh_027220 [Apium graveolens]